MQAHPKGEPDDAPDMKAERVTATVDTIELFFVRPPKGLRKSIEKPLGRRVKIRNCYDNTGYFRGVEASINRPNLAVLPLLNNYRRYTNGCSTCRVDIAYDFVMESEAAAKVLRNYLEQYVLMKWRARGSRDWVGSTVYWLKEGKTRNLCMYWKRHQTIRLELRFLNSRSVRRAGLDDIAGLRHLNPAPLFEHNIKVVRFTEQYIGDVTRRTVKDDRLHI